MPKTQASNRLFLSRSLRARSNRKGESCWQDFAESRARDERTCSRPSAETSCVLGGKICKSTFPASACSEIQWMSAVSELTTLKMRGIARDRHVHRCSAVAALGQKGQGGGVLAYPVLCSCILVDPRRSPSNARLKWLGSATFPSPHISYGQKERHLIRPIRGTQNGK